MKIHHRLVFVLSVMSILITIVSSFAYVFLAINSLRNRIEAQLQSIVVLKEGELSKFYDRSMHTISIVSEQDSVQTYLNEVAIGFPYQDSSKKAVISLHKILPHSTFSEIHLVDATAQSDISTEASDSARDWGNEQLFTEGKKALFIQNFYYDVVFQQPRITMSAPVKNQKNEVIGVIIAIVKMDEISNLMTERSGLGQTGETYLVNKFNYVVSELKKEKEGKIKTNAYADQSTIYTDNVKDCIKGNQKFTTYKDYAGDTVLGLYKWIPDKEVCLLAQIDSSEAFAPINQLKFAAVILGFVLVILTFILGTIFAWSISKPIVLLRDAALEVGKGNLDVKIEIKTTDEIGQLATAFNDMKSKLRDLYSGLEGKVREKTAELEKEKAGVEQKVIERTQQLAYEQARLQASINSLSVGYLMTGIDNKLIMINKAAKDILTLTTSTAKLAEKVLDVTEIRENITMDFIQDALKDKVDLLSQIEDAKNKTSNVILKDIPYRMLFLNIYIAPIVNKTSKEIIGTVILLEDTTEQKIIERSRDEFFSIASHELRTPLTAIRGNTALIKDYFWKEITNDTIKESIDDIHESSIRLIQIVNDFLDVSRMEQGKLQFSCDAFDVVKLANEVVKEYDVTGSRQKLYLRVSTPPEPIPLVYADQNRVRQVLTNLVGNGIKFTKEGGVEISFAVHETNLNIYVTDTGQGIPEANRNLLFRKFQQAESNILTRDNTRGTGLGLYISKVLMTNMGGNIELEKTEEGKGSTFKVVIPTATPTQINNPAKEIHA